MKKYIYIILACATLLCASCRKEAADMPDPNLDFYYGYFDYEHQFQTVWTGISNSYVHWSDDTVDWDARYQRLLPKFMKLDSIVADTTLPDSLRCIPYSTFSDLYKELLYGLRDHHMMVRVKNIVPAPDDATDIFSYYPGQEEVTSRDYYHSRIGMEVEHKALALLGRQGRVTNLMFDSCIVEGTQKFSAIACLIDGKYAYLRLSNYFLTELTADESSLTADQQRVLRVYKSWLELCFRPATEGVILDNRSNTGGIVNDLQLVISPFLAADQTPAYSRTKNGLHRLDYTPWAPVVIHKTEPNRPDLKYVVLADVWSVSMGEMTTAAVKAMPKGYVIGERTYGGHGPLSGNFGATYSGTFGNPDGYHYVYTSSHQLKFEEGGILEGIGITPDEEVLINLDLLRENHVDNQLGAALKYLNNAK